MSQKNVQLPPLEVLQQAFDYRPETGEVFWRHRPLDFFRDKRAQSIANARAGKEATSVARNRWGYEWKKVGLTWDSSRQRRNILAHRIIWKLMTGDEPPEQIDHIDGNALNNRWANLRDGTATNHMNRAMPKDNSSGVTGVYWMAKKRKWAAGVKIEGRSKHLGLFSPDDLDLAAMEVLEAKADMGYSPRHGVQLAPYHMKEAG